MTNIAEALALDPELPELVGELIVMGGAFGFNDHRGNVSPVAEANIAGDPLAADIVFSCGMPTTIVGLDVTDEVIMSSAYVDALRVDAGAAGEFLYQISRHYLAFNERSTGRFECSTHDPSAVAYLLRPEIFQTRDAAVRVVTEGIAMGQTIWSEANPNYFTKAWSDVPTCRICTGVDSQALLKLYRDTLTLAVQ
jgi:inosine-uridine nucleoside N-ribohydrolase